MNTDNKKKNQEKFDSTLSKNTLISKDQTLEHLNKEIKKVNNEQKTTENNETQYLYNFLMKKENSKSFQFNYQKNQFNSKITCDEINKLKGKIDLLITIDVIDDTSQNGISLQKTLDCIFTNFSKLNKYTITNEKIAIFIFFEYINIKENFNIFFQTVEKQNNKSIYGNIFKYLQYDLYIFNTKFSFDFVNTIFDHNLNNNFFLLKLKNGIRFKTPNVISSLIDCSLTKKDKKTVLIIPLIEIESLSEQTQNLFTEFENYENFLYNIYDLNYFDLSITVPENDYVTFYNLDKHIIDKFNQFYSTNYLNEYYNSHSLSIYLKLSEYNVIFASEIICYKNRNLITFSQMKNHYINKRSNDFLALYDLLYNFSEFTLTNKLIIIHRIIGLLFSFLYPSFSTMFIFCIFQEAFNTYKTSFSFFFSCINIFFTILFISIGFIQQKEEIKIETNEYQSKIDEMNSIYFFVFDCYYILIFICSIPAIYYIDHNKPPSNYKFKKIFCLSLIIINFVLSIIPILFYLKTFFGKIKKSFKYLILACPGYNGFFNILGIIQCLKTDSKKTKSILLLCISNCFILIFGYCLNNRKRRMNFVEVLSIIFTIYNGIKIICIIINTIINESGEYDEENINNLNKMKKENKIDKEKEKIDDKNNQFENKNNEFKIEMADVNQNNNNKKNEDKFSEDEIRNSIEQKQLKNVSIKEKDISINFENDGNKKK